MEKLQVKGHSNLFRDTSTNAILNTDMNAYQNYIESKKIKDNEVKRMSDIENDLNSLKSDVNEIKSMLRSLIDGSK